MGMRHVIPELIKKVHFSEGGGVEVFSTSHSRTFCYVSDAVQMIGLLLSHDKSIGNVFNIGNQSPEIKIKDLAGLIAECIGKNIRIIDAGETSGSPTRRAPDMSSFCAIEDYKSKVNLREGILNCYEWYQKNVFSLSS